MEDVPGNDGSVKFYTGLASLVSAHVIWFSQACCKLQEIQGQNEQNLGKTKVINNLYYSVKCSWKNPIIFPDSFPLVKLIVSVFQAHL